MAVIETKFSVGDIVWFANTTTETKQHPCPDCNDTHKWQAISPAGNEYSFGCPRCSKTYSAHDELSLRYTAHIPCVKRLTIGSVRHDSHKFGGGSETQYMCVETGVGSGNLYNEDRLFSFEDEALKAAQAIADNANVTMPHIVERYNRTLDISDYQLENGLIKQAQKDASRARSMLWNLNDLFAQIGEAETKDEIVELVDDYKNYRWERDKAEASATPSDLADEAGI